MARDIFRVAPWPEWSRRDYDGLARYVTPRSGQWLALGLNRFDVDASASGRRIVVEEIYRALAAQAIRYASEDYHPAEAVQRIRTPHEILVAPREGTCLDLATFFCG